MTKEFKWMIKTYAVILWLMVAIRFYQCGIMDAVWYLLCLI